MNAIDLLNSAFAADPNAIHSLLVNRVPCNQSLADHATVQVDASAVLPDACFQVGMLGVINGILESSGQPLVAVQWSEPNDDGLRRIIGFCEYVGVSR